MQMKHKFKWFVTLVMIMLSNSLLMTAVHAQTNCTETVLYSFDEGTLNGESNGSVIEAYLGTYVDLTQGDEVWIDYYIETGTYYYAWVDFNLWDEVYFLKQSFLEMYGEWDTRHTNRMLAQIDADGTYYIDTNVFIDTPNLESMPSLGGTVWVVHCEDAATTDPAPTDPAPTDPTPSAPASSNFVTSIGITHANENGVQHIPLTPGNSNNEKANQSNKGK